MYQKNKGVFIVLNHFFKPVPNNKTEVTQQIEFVDRLKNRNMKAATAIIELTEKRLVKDRSREHTFDTIMDLVKEQYPEQLENLLEMTQLKEQFSTPKLPEELAIHAKEVLEEIKKENEAKATKKKVTKKRATKKVAGE